MIVGVVSVNKNVYKVISGWKQNYHLRYHLSHFASMTNLQNIIIIRIPLQGI